MAKILVIDKCIDCSRHCVFGYLDNDVKKELSYFCDKKRKIILKVKEIPEWCPLPNRPKLSEERREDIMKKFDMVRKYIADGGRSSYPSDFMTSVLDGLDDADKEGEVIGIPCSHVAPEGSHNCEKCGEFLGC